MSAGVDSQLRPAFGPRHRPVLDLFWTSFGTVLDLGPVLDQFWTCFEDLFWTCSGPLLDRSAHDALKRFRRSASSGERPPDEKIRRPLL